MGHSVVPEETGRGDFLWILSVLVVGTVILANMLRYIIKILKVVWEPIRHLVGNIWFALADNLSDFIRVLWAQLQARDDDHRHKVSDVEVAIPG